MERNNEMEFKIQRAKQSDAEELFAVMMAVWEQLEDKSLYYADDLAYIKKCIQTEGIVLKVLDLQGKIAAFLLMYIPKDDAEHLGHMCKMKKEQREATVYMDSIAVLPKYRGYGLQQRLLKEGENCEILPEKRYLMATVAPENEHSLHNFLSLGYYIVCETKKYGGLQRFVLLKERSGEDEKRGD